MESGYNYQYLYDLLKSEGYNVKVAHPLMVKAFAYAETWFEIIYPPKCVVGEAHGFTNTTTIIYNGRTPLLPMIKRCLAIKRDMIFHPYCFDKALPFGVLPIFQFYSYNFYR
jgi:hypothetical protein